MVMATEIINVAAMQQNMFNKTGRQAVQQWNILYSVQNSNMDWPIWISKFSTFQVFNQNNKEIYAAPAQGNNLEAAKQFISSIAVLDLV